MAGRSHPIFTDGIGWYRIERHSFLRSPPHININNNNAAHRSPSWYQSRLSSSCLLECWPIPDRGPSVQGGDQSKAQSASTAAVTVVEAGAEVPYTNAGVNKDGDVR